MTSLARMKESQDAFGHALLDHLDGQETYEIIERDDGLIDISASAERYFAPFAAWSPLEQAAAQRAVGRVLDVGCGAGRFAVHLQEQGREIVAIDVSPLAIAVCKRRGVRDARVLSITAVPRSLGRFDTILMMGNNFGLFGSRLRARWLLRRFRRNTSPEARIIAQVLDPFQTTDPFHLAYQEANRRRGRMSGQIRMRVRYRKYATPWFDYLFVSLDELRDIVDETGWHVAEVIGTSGPLYIVQLEKSAS
ncbi:MAG: class I SAM-dependent methyltransferase [Longimicrobiales bacterium]